MAKLARSPLPRVITFHTADEGIDVMAHKPIRLRLVPRKSSSDSSDARIAFWQSVRNDSKLDGDISDSEGQLCREFGVELRRSLVRHLAEPLDRLSDRRSGPGRDLEHLIFRFFDGPKYEREGDRGQILTVIARLLEQEHELVRESPAAISAREKIALAGSVIFSTKISGYSSLNLDLSVGSINKVADIFENDFESFRIFLDAFVPTAFADVFTIHASDAVDFSVHIPESYRQEFSVAPASGAPIIAGNNQPQSDSVAVAPSTTSRERAEWLWRLANGSLLVPLLLALLVMYEGMSTLKDIRNLQYEAMKPIFEHQLKMLEEDRKRLFKEADPATGAAKIPVPPAKP